MSLTACRECKKEVSTEATTCPHCGVPSPARERSQAPSTKLCLQCKREVSTEAASCPYCGVHNPTVSIFASSDASNSAASNDLPTSNSNRLVVGIGCVAIVVLLLGFCFKSCADAQDKYALDTPNGNRVGAAVACQGFVKQKMKTPATATFHWNGTTDDYVSTPAPETFEVRGTVDAQNSFGALLTNTYVCRVRHTQGANYVLESLTMR
jgi:RNA polymerase subunit RPABC4/transcription elongation factor Spt4